MLTKSKSEHNGFILHIMWPQMMIERCFFGFFFLIGRKDNMILARTTMDTDLLVICIAGVAGDREILQQVDAVIFVISTQSSFQQSLPVIVIPATPKETVASVICKHHSFYFFFFCFIHVAKYYSIVFYLLLYYVVIVWPHSCSPEKHFELY